MKKSSILFGTDACPLPVHGSAHAGLRRTLGGIAMGVCLFGVSAASAQQNEVSRTHLATSAPRSGVGFAHPTRITPTSNIAKPGDAGKRMHTNLQMLGIPSDDSAGSPPFPYFAYETPASLACVYYLAPRAPGSRCNPNEVTAVPQGGSQTIAIVDAYDDPSAAGDLAYFSAQFGLPFSASQFQVVQMVDAFGYTPGLDSTGGWEAEEALDIEYAHAMAPKAKIYLVEAVSNSDADLYSAVQAASSLIVCGLTSNCPSDAKGKGIVSMSFSGSEYPDEVLNDAIFTTPGVTYIAATGDSSGTGYPAVSPNVIAAGGTSISRNPNYGDLQFEMSWEDGGGGLSYYEPIPSYQSAIPAIAAMAYGSRATPDISFDANPSTGVWVYDTFPMQQFFDTGFYGSNWFVFGGTSVSTPALAGIINSAGSFAPSTAAELTTIYAARNTNWEVRDIKYGVCGFYAGTLATPGYDLCTGVGSSLGLLGK